MQRRDRRLSDQRRACARNPSRHQSEVDSLLSRLYLAIGMPPEKDVRSGEMARE